MPEENVHELRPVEHITADAVGAPGNRIFYIQGWTDESSISLIVDKFQLQTLAVAVEQFLADLDGKLKNLPPASADYDVDKMRIKPPVEPLFKVGQVGLGYDSSDDLVALELRELIQEDQKDLPGQQVVRYWCSRSQMRALINWGLEVIRHGRPLCPQCGQPMDPDGHLCPRKNGHKV
jgi:uncharacterized repeat protein (TIGR03847 family)